MQNRFRGWTLIHGILLSVMVLTACGQSQIPGGVEALPSAGTGPRIILTPQSGYTGSSLTIDGAGFPTNKRIQIGLSSTTVVRNPVQIGEVVASNEGQFKLIFIIPRTWQDGSLIIDDGLTITASSIDPLLSASAKFSITNAPGPTLSISKEIPTLSPSGQSKPNIILIPTGGSAGTPIVVRGTGFPASTEIIIRLGIPGAGAVAQIYARAVSDISGNVTTGFTMPAAWPDGKQVVEKRLMVVATTLSDSTSSVAEFAFSGTKTPVSPGLSMAPPVVSTVNPKPSPVLTTTRPIVTPTVAGIFSHEPISVSVDFLNSLLRDPSGASSVVYLSQRLHADITANWVLPTGLGIQPGYSSFFVALLTNAEDSVVIQATLSYESGASVRNFTLIKEDGVWRIDKVVSGSR